MRLQVNDYISVLVIILSTDTDTTKEEMPDHLVAKLLSWYTLMKPTSRRVGLCLFKARRKKRGSTQAMENLDI